MRLKREWFIHEEKYEYENEQEKEVHEKFMIDKGYRVVSHPITLSNPLVNTYQKRQLIRRG